MRYFSLILCLFLLFGCQSKEKDTMPTDTIEQNAPEQISAESSDIAESQPEYIFHDPLDLNEYSQYRNYAEIQYKTGMIYRWEDNIITYYMAKDISRRVNPSLIRKAFNHWAKYSGIFHFVQVADPNDADISIVLDDTQSAQALGEAHPDKIIASGRTYSIGDYTLREGIIKHAIITISAEYFSYENVKNYRENGVKTPFQTLVHEIGHTLGIMEHSMQQGDCMYYQADRRGVSCDNIATDTNTLAMIYGLPNKLKMAKRSKTNVEY